MSAYKSAESFHLSIFSIIIDELDIIITLVSFCNQAAKIVNSIHKSLNDWQQHVDKIETFITDWNKLPSCV